MDVRRTSLGAVAAASRSLQSWHVCKTLTGEDSNSLHTWRLCVYCILSVARVCLITLTCLSRRITRPSMLFPNTLLHGTEAQNRAICVQELPCRLDAIGPCQVLHMRWALEEDAACSCLPTESSCLCRLDAIGAIGIARCFTYGGHFKRVLHDQAVAPRSELTKQQYTDRAFQQTTINHFHEKLLKLKVRRLLPDACTDSSHS